VTRVGLVLGAGGITGFGYHSGVLSALSRVTGWDPRTAEVIVGTSAGAAFGAVLRGGVRTDDVLAHLLAAPSNPDTMARLRTLSGRDVRGPSWLWFGPAAPGLVVSELTRMWRLRPGVLSAALLPSGRIPTSIIGDRARALHGAGWPDAALWVCAVRLDDGERIVFGIDGRGVDTGTAVEASCAIPAFFRPVTIDGVAHIDGAVHSPTNADLLAGHDLDLVVIVSPMSSGCGVAVRSLNPLDRIRSARLLAREVGQLKAGGTPVLILQPDQSEVATMGPVTMDPTRLVPTILQASSSTLERLTGPSLVERLDVLRRAAETQVPPADVPYPGGAAR
jgi:NTE family protein